MFITRELFYELKRVMNVIRDSQYPPGWFLIYTRGSIKKSPLISDISKKILCLCVVQLSLFVYHCRIEPRSFVTWICGAENQKTNAHTRRFFSHTTFFPEKKIQNVGYSCFRWPFYLTDCCQPVCFFMTFTMYKVEHPPILEKPIVGTLIAQVSLQREKSCIIHRRHFVGLDMTNLLV